MAAAIRTRSACRRQVVARSGPGIDHIRRRSNDEKTVDFGRGRCRVVVLASARDARSCTRGAQSDGESVSSNTRGPPPGGMQAACTSAGCGPAPHIGGMRVGGMRAGSHIGRMHAGPRIGGGMRHGGFAMRHGGHRPGGLAFRHGPNFGPGKHFRHHPGFAFNHGKHFRHHRRFYALPYVAYPYYAYSYSGGGCYWLKERAIVTGSSYWWRRYDECRYDWD